MDFIRIKKNAFFFFCKSTLGYIKIRYILEKIFITSEKGPGSRILKELLQLDNKERNQTFQMGQTLHKRRYTSSQYAHEMILSHQGIEAKSKMRLRGMSEMRMSKIRKTDITKCWQRGGTGGILSRCWRECKTVHSRRKTVCQCLC